MRARSLLLFAACNLAACGPTYSPVAPDTTPEPAQPVCRTVLADLPGKLEVSARKGDVRHTCDGLYRCEGSAYCRIEVMWRGVQRALVSGSMTVRQGSVKLSDRAEVTGTVGNDGAPQVVGLCAGYGEAYSMFIALGAGTVISNVMIQSGGARCP